MPSLICSRKFKMAVMALGSILFAWYVCGDNLAAQWWIIDDHEIMHFLGPDGKVGIHDIIPLLLKTEAGSPGEFVRYRPSYYFLRIGETFLWGNSPQLWYGCRLAMFAASAAILWWIADQFIGLLAGMLFVLYVFAFPYWADIWARLGPAEIYAVFGTALFALGYVHAIRALNAERAKGERTALDWLLMLFGALIAMGSKENFLLLLLPVALLCLLLWRRRALGKPGLLCSAAMLGYGAFVGTAVGIGLARAKADVYANSVDPAARTTLFWGGVRMVFANHLLTSALVAVAVLVIASVLRLRVKGDEAALRDVKKGIGGYLAAGVALIFLVLSQYVFYNGKWPVNSRYDFPGALAGPLFMLATAVLLKRLANLLFPGKRGGRGVLLLFSLLLAFLVGKNGFGDLKGAIGNNVLRTRAFTGQMTALARLLKNEPAAGLVFESYSARDHEPISSVAIFLRGYGVANPFYLRLHTHEGYQRHENEVKLTAELLDISANGGDGKRGWDYKGFRPLDGLGRAGGCYSVSFSSPESAFTDCAYLGQVF